jgi:hypothetical protein
MDLTEFSSVHTVQIIMVNMYSWKILVKFLSFVVIFNSELKFEQHICSKITKAYSMLGIIKRNFRNVCNKAFIYLFIYLFKVLVIPHLVYAEAAWSPRG